MPKLARIFQDKMVLQRGRPALPFEMVCDSRENDEYGRRETV